MVQVIVIEKCFKTTENVETVQFIAIRVTMFKKILCWLDFHDWNYLSDDLCVKPYPRESFEWFAKHQQCKNCNLLIDTRCENCIKHGTGYCLEQISKADEYRRLKRNCCIHCPRTYHKH